MIGPLILIGLVGGLWLGFFDQPMVTALFLGFFLWLLLRALGAKAIKRGIKIEFTQGIYRCFSREKLQVTIRISNTSSFRIPTAVLKVNTGSLAPGKEDERRYSLEPKEYQYHSLELRPLQRGVYELGPAEVVLAHPFGFSWNHKKFSISSLLVAYPSPGALPITAKYGLQGDGNSSRAIEHQDPSMVASLRTYRRGDPLKSIHWKASARSLDLMVKEPEYHFHSPVELMVILHEEMYPLKRRSFFMEQSLEMAAGIIRHCHHNQYPAGLHLLGSIRSLEKEEYTEGTLSIFSRSGSQHFTRMLEVLACAAPGSESYDLGISQMRMMCSKLEGIPTLVIIGPLVQEEHLLNIVQWVPRRTVVHYISSDQPADIVNKYPLWKQLTGTGIKSKGSKLKLFPLNLYGKLYGKIN